MEMGFGIPVSGSWATPANIREICRRAEALGYSSLWSFQRTLYPGGDPIPMPYRSVHDPLAISAYVAGVTERARISIAIVNLPFYSPIVLAKTLTSIDILSGGRLDAGLGLGWNPDEFAAAGAPMERRGARAEEFIACLRAIWTQDPVSFDGEFYRVPSSYVDPKPVQRPHPPILLGGSAEKALVRAGRLAAGWVSASRFAAAEVPGAVDIVKRSAREAGRDPADLRIIIRAAVRVRERDEDQQFTGTLDKVKKDFADYASAGATELFVDLNFDEQIGNPDVDPAESMRRAHVALDAFAP
ncbi:MAG TPA: TIGR03619 family F420-dependent LLM class oxidoreductase [Mycobacteriales bacterium]|jgi:probable F420-dependent oxidoreductase|nr:TIGR03619 family F420-dependent LLM class oxidoreductase [Mycobacteriales bacterium]